MKKEVKLSEDEYRELAKEILSQEMDRNLTEAEKIYVQAYRKRH